MGSGPRLLGGIPVSATGEDRGGSDLPDMVARDPGQCRFRPASFDVLIEAESGGAGCMPDEKGRTSMGARTEALAGGRGGGGTGGAASVGEAGGGEWEEGGPGEEC